jgi:hypothetical protein
VAPEPVCLTKIEAYCKIVPSSALTVPRIPPAPRAEEIKPAQSNATIKHFITTIDAKEYLKVVRTITDKTAC